MKAAVLTDDGVEIQERDAPDPDVDQILVRVHACGLNRADLLMFLGRSYAGRGGAGTVAGLEWSGEIVQVGAAVPDFRVGDRVMCSGAGGFAEYAVCDWGRAAPIPANNMNFAQAATLPVALQTMHDAVVTHGRLAQGESVLVQGASSGVGLMAMQIAKFKGAELVIGTSTDPRRRARLNEYGADLALDSADPGWVEKVQKATKGKGVDLIIDQISASVANQNLAAAAILGRIVNVGRLGGMTGEFDFDLHALKRIDYIGVTFRTRCAEEVREISRLMRADLWSAIEDGRLSLPIDRVFPFEDVAAALEHMKANNHFGKIVLDVES